MSAHPIDVPVIDVVEAESLLAGDALLMDVRDAHEWAAGHLQHCVHVPLADVSDSARFTTTTRTVICVSRSGRRAREAATHLRTAGVDAVVLRGGLRAWLDADGPLVTSDGRPGHLA
jgi:rhodanese-related sulfurtransferase